jgi:quercetin 2,3-dioxygenase
LWEDELHQHNAKKRIRRLRLEQQQHHVIPWIAIHSSNTPVLIKSTLSNYSCFMSLTSIIASPRKKFYPRRFWAFATAALSFTTPTVSLSSLPPQSVCTMPSIKVIPQEKLYISEPDPSWFGNSRNPTNDPSWTNANWLRSRFHFSFAEYSSFKNSQFGVIRVLNDDLVQPHRGFGAHPHANMEIVTYIVQGELTHQDNMGTKETLGRGSIQFMTAGTGIRHSEHNLGDKPLRFIQTWIQPSRSGLPPQYGSYAASSEEPKNTWRHLVSGFHDATVDTPVKVHQDVDGYAAELEQDQSVSFPLQAGRQAYLVSLEGTIDVNGKEVRAYDACEIVGTGDNLVVKAKSVESTTHGPLAHVLMFTMKHVPGSGRKDL